MNIDIGKLHDVNFGEQFPSTGRTFARIISSIQMCQSSDAGTRILYPVASKPELERQAKEMNAIVKSLGVPHSVHIRNSATFNMFDCFVVMVVPRCESLYGQHFHMVAPTFGEFKNMASRSVLDCFYKFVERSGLQLRLLTPLDKTQIIRILK